MGKHNMSQLQCWVLGGHTHPQPCHHQTAASPGCNNQPCPISGTRGSLHQSGSRNNRAVLLSPQQGCAAKPLSHGHVVMERGWRRRSIDLQLSPAAQGSPSYINICQAMHLCLSMAVNSSLQCCHLRSCHSQQPEPSSPFCIPTHHPTFSLSNPRAASTEPVPSWAAPRGGSVVAGHGWHTQS